MRRAQIINVEISEAGAGLLRASSPDMHNLLIHRETEDDLKAAVFQFITEMMSLKGETVQVFEADPQPESCVYPWIIAPAASHSCA